MKKLAVIAFGFWAACAQAHPMRSLTMSPEAATPSPAEASFDRLKALQGTWKFGNYTVSFEVASQGSIVIERFDNMVSVYYLDGDSVMLTHYCDIGNQPRMRATRLSDPKTLTFDFVDVTNVKPGQGHIRGLTTRWLDNGHIQETWKYQNADGSNGEDAVFELARAGVQ